MVLIKLLLSLLIGVVTAIPDNLLCCPESSVLNTNDEKSTISCLDAKTNNTSPVKLKCEMGSVIISEKEMNFTVTNSGEVLYNNLNNYWSKMDMEKELHCLTNVTVTMENGLVETEKVMVLCVTQEENNSALAYCIIISIVFLSITTIVYASLPDLRDLQGKSIASLCGSFALGFLFLAINNLMEYSDMTMCAIRGFLQYFFLLASFFWTNAISIQILLNMRRPVVNKYDWKTFSWYALYAWGCPTMLTTCMAIVNYHPGDHIKPGIGLNHCWFFDGKQQWYYMYSVMTILIVANTCIFIYTSIYLWRRSFTSSHVKTLRYKFIMSLRMFIIMGLPWVTEMISSLVKEHVIWYILDIFNMLQGPLIFLLLVVFRKRVVKALLKRGLLDCVAGPVERYLALGEDDEEGVIQHTIDHTMHEKDGI